MKKLIVLCLILIVSTNLWSQKNYEIDSIISVTIPGENIIIDTLLNGTIIFKSEVSGYEYLAKKELFENDTISSYKSNLPYDSESLEDCYESLTNTYVKNFNLVLESKKMIEKNSLKGFHSKFKDPNNNAILEIEYFLLNKNIYLFSLKNINESDKNLSDDYFNSIKINSEKETYQFSGKTSIEKSAYNIGYKLGGTLARHPSILWGIAGFLLFLVIGVIIYFIQKNKTN